MSSEAIAQYLPIIKQAALVNSFLVLYYIMPNFTSFALTALLAVALLAPDALKEVSCCQAGQTSSLNELFQAYLSLNNIRKLMVIVLVGVVAQLTYLLPSWLLLFFAAQIFAFYELLVSLGAVELLSAYMSNTESAITKFLNLIPRYQE